MILPPLDPCPGPRGGIARPLPSIGVLALAALLGACSDPAPSSATDDPAPGTADPGTIAAVADEKAELIERARTDPDSVDIDGASPISSPRVHGRILPYPEGDLSKAKGPIENPNKTKQDWLDRHMGGDAWRDSLSLAFHGRDGDSLPFRLYVPEGDLGEETYPLVLVFHGHGDFGTDNRWQMKWGHTMPALLRKDANSDYPCFVLAPHSPGNGRFVSDGEGNPAPVLRMCMEAVSYTHLTLPTTVIV